MVIIIRIVIERAQKIVQKAMKGKKGLVKEFIRTRWAEAKDE